MGCGCRKNKTVQPVQQTQVQVQESTTNQPNQSGSIQLTEQQQQQVDVIIDKLRKLNS
jgi:hypothetical protein